MTRGRPLANRPHAGTPLLSGGVIRDPLHGGLHEGTPHPGVLHPRAAEMIAIHDLRRVGEWIDGQSRRQSRGDEITAIPDPLRRSEVADIAEE